jgi:hypothetical protein
MNQAAISSRSTTINIDDIITILRISTQNQYNARELHTTVSLNIYIFR